MYDIKRSDRDRISQFAFEEKLAGGTNIEVPVFTAPENCTIVKISFVNENTIVRSDTNHEHIYFYDKGAAGTASNIIISGTTGNTISGGQALNAFDEINMVDLDTTSAISGTHSVLAKGDVVSVATVSGGTGVTLGRALINIYYRLNDIETNIHDP